jgi:hypothetical protein
VQIVLPCCPRRYIATGGSDGLVCLWDAQDFICLRTYMRYDLQILHVAFSHDSRYIAVVPEGRTVERERYIQGPGYGTMEKTVKEKVLEGMVAVEDAEAGGWGWRVMCAGSGQGNIYRCICWPAMASRQ